MTYRRLPNPFTPAELRRLRETTTRPEVRAVMTFLRETGLRSAEACSITTPVARSWRQPPRWCRRRTCTRHTQPLRVIGKGDKERAILLTPAALRAAHILVGYSRNGHMVPWSDRGLRNVLQKAGEQAGVHCHAHRFRHTHVTELVEAGVPIEVVAEMVGHSRLDFTRLYWGASEQLRAGALARRGRHVARA